MTQGDKDRTIGQARREYREAKHDLAALKLRAHQMGEYFGRLCALLVNEPQNVIFDNQTYAEGFAPAQGLIFDDVRFSAFTAKAIRELTDEIRTATVRVATLRQFFLDLEGSDF